MKFQHTLSSINDIITVIKADKEMIKVLEIVRDLDLTDSRIGAWFIRNKVWNHLHGYDNNIKQNDIDIVYFDKKDFSSEEQKLQSTKREEEIENTLKKIKPNISRSVSNQARMHYFNRDKAYTSSSDAIAYWPETATCIGIRLDEQDNLHITAPHGIDDLIQWIVRPTNHFTSSDIKNKIYKEIIHKKNWNQTRPLLMFID